MRQSSLIAAHLAAHSYRDAIFTPGLGYVAASGTVAEETSHYYDQAPVISQLCLHLWFAGLRERLIARKLPRQEYWACRVADILAGFGDGCRRYPLTRVRVPASPMLFKLSAI